MMKHYIIVKFTEGTDVKALVEPVRKIFEETLAIPGIHSLDIRISNSDMLRRSRTSGGRASMVTESPKRPFLIVTFEHNFSFIPSNNYENVENGRALW